MDDETAPPAGGETTRPRPGAGGPGPETGAEALLAALAACGVDCLFANAGTDFPPLIEGMARLGPAAVPAPVTVPHETAAVAMAHGYWLVTGRPQAVMVHVNVGLANAAMGVINAASDDVPLLVLSGRTPLTATGRAGARATPIQYGQEMYDQASIVRDVVKFTYEMRYPEQGDTLVKRAAALARSAPSGPVYLSLPREPLTEALPEGFAPAALPPPAAPSAPDPAAIATLARWLEAAEAPVILCQRGDPEGRLGPLLSRLAARHGIGVAEPFSVRNVLASDDPALLGYDPAEALDGADLVIVLDSAVPWIEALHAPAPAPGPADGGGPRTDGGPGGDGGPQARRDTGRAAGRAAGPGAFPGAATGPRIAHVAPDPLFRRMPVRGYRSDLSIAAEPVRALEALEREAAPGEAASGRFARVAARAQARRERAAEQARAGATPLSPAWFSACVSQIMDARAVAFTELGLLPGFMELQGQNRLFSNVHAGGLGWAMPAALGAQLADRERLVIAAMGDGSYMFANPVACHQVAEALGLPILTIVKNNAMWNAVRRAVVRGYPGGAAARMNEMPLTSLAPLPDFCAVARASRAHAERVERGEDLPAALARALEAVRDEQRQALLDVAVAATDSH